MKLHEMTEVWIMVRMQVVSRTPSVRWAFYYAGKMCPRNFVPQIKQTGIAFMMTKLEREHIRES